MTDEDVEAIKARLDELGDGIRDHLRAIADDLTPKLSDRAKRTSGRAINPIRDGDAS